MRENYTKDPSSGPYLQCVHPQDIEQALHELHERICGSHIGGRSLSFLGRKVAYSHRSLLLLLGFGRLACRFNNNSEFQAGHSPFCVRGDLDLVARVLPRAIAYGEPSICAGLVVRLQRAQSKSILRARRQAIRAL